MKRRAALAVAVAAIAALPACGESHEDLAVTVREWSLDVRPATTDSGTITLAVDNAGTLEHELLLVPLAGNGTVPTKPNGEADLTTAVPADKLEPFGPGRFKASFIRILPGDYVMLCNLVSDGVSHYAKGLSARLKVTPTKRDRTTTSR